MTVNITNLNSKELLDLAKNIRAELASRTVRVVKMGDNHAALVMFAWEHLGLTAQLFNQHGFEVKLLSDLDLPTLQQWTKLLTYLSEWDGASPLELVSDYSDILEFVADAEDRNSPDGEDELIG
jgi:hypothetical protein